MDLLPFSQTQIDIDLYRKILNNIIIYYKHYHVINNNKDFGFSWWLNDFILSFD